MRTVNVYPKAFIDGATWTYVLKLFEAATGNGSRFVHVVPAGVTTPRPLPLLKLCFNLLVPDGTPDTDIDNALFTLDIRPGQQSETVWGNWQTLAEGIITGLLAEFTVEDFWAAWTFQDTAAIRTDARRALITLQTGWTVDEASVHQHEGDGSNRDGTF